jgi:hypothetical protein
MKKTNTLFALAIMTSMPLMSQTWGTSGNTVTTGQYIGASNQATLDLRTSGTSRIAIDYRGNYTFSSFASPGAPIKLLQTANTGLVTPFTMSTAANVLCGDGAWRPLNTISSAQWISSGTHLYNGNTGSVGIGVNPTSLIAPAKSNVLGDIDKTVSLTTSNHTTDFGVNTNIKINRVNTIAIAVENVTPVIDPTFGGSYRVIPLAINGNGSMQFSSAGNSNNEIITVKTVTDPISNHLLMGKGFDKSYFTLFKDGKLLIGDGYEWTLPQYVMPTNIRLAVNGKIICEELVVKLRANWPDYVFGDTYKLKDLNELETFITANKHLPNIPSAQEVADKGFETGDIIKRQMEKIEELSLYLIQHNKLIAEQQKQLDLQSRKSIEQEKRLELLEAKMK